MPKFYDDIIQGSEIWKEFRRTHISATDLSIIMQISPYKSPYMLWCEKLGLTTTDFENDAMRRGKELEPLALQKYHDVKPLYKMQPVVVTHTEYPFAMASLDGYDHFYNRLVEVKCMGKKNHEEAMNGDVKPLYNIQMQWQMFVTDSVEADYFAFSEESHIIITVKRDQDLIDDMIIKAKEFLGFLNNIIPPPFTDLDYDDRKSDPNWTQLELAYAECDAQEKASKRSKEIIKGRMIALSNGRNVIGSNSKFTRVLSKGKVQYDNIPELKDVNLEQYRGPDVESFRITITKD